MLSGHADGSIVRYYVSEGASHLDQQQVSQEGDMVRGSQNRTENTFLSGG